MLLPNRASVAPVRLSSEGLRNQHDAAVKIRVHRVCLFGFDENRGNSLLASSKINKRPVITSHSDAELAEICLPDGGHLREHDCMSMIFRTGSEKILYGYACFRNVRNQQEKRGARQTSLLIISDSPGMDLFRPFLADALEILVSHQSWGNAEFWKRALNSLKAAIEQGFNNGLALSNNKRLLDSEKEATISVELWNRSYVIRPPSFSPGELGGASLKDLLKVFKERTMKLWYAVASERRIMFVAPNMSAGSVSNLVLAAPLLVGELAPFVVQTLEPYVTLAVVDRITRKKSFICGSNNVLFQHKPEWWDVCADVSSGAIQEEFHHTAPSQDEHRSETALSPPSTSRGGIIKGIRHKLSHHRSSSASYNQATTTSGSSSNHHHHKLSGGAEMAFVSRVLHDMEFQSEAWLRRQFHDFTLSFLNRVGRREAQIDLATALAGLFPGVSIIQPRIARFAEQFPSTSLWKQYRTKQDEIWGGSSSDPQNVMPGSVSSPIANSPTSSAPEEPSFLSGNAGIKTLAPFAFENASGVSRPPTGFVSVKDLTLTNPKKKTTTVSPTSKLKFACNSEDSENQRWVKVLHENGEPYYWNVSSGETKWEIPDDDLL